MLTNKLNDTSRLEEKTKLGFWKKLWLILDSKDRWQLIGILFLQIIGSMVEVVGLGAIPAFILTLANPAKILTHKIAGPLLARFNITTTSQLLIWGASALIVVFVFKNIFLVAVGFIKANYLRNLQVRYGLELFHRYMYADYIYLLEHNTAELLRNCVTEVSQVVVGILQSTLNLFMDIVLVINISIVLFIMEPIASISTILVIGSISFLFLKFTRRRMEVLGQKAQQARMSIVKAVNQGLNGIKETRIMHAENFFTDSYRMAFKQMAHSEKIRVMLSSTIRPLFETLAVGALLLITVLMYLQSRSLESIIPILSVFSVAMIRLLPAIREITTTISMLRYSFVSINPIYESRFIPLIPVDTYDSANQKSPETDDIKFNYTIRFENLSYTYPSATKPAVDKVTLEIRKGEVVAFVGSSGAGKTTLLDLVSGLISPQSGSILVDGKDITGNMRQWQKHLGYIPQFIYLADASLRDNILWGIPENGISEDNYQMAIKTAQLETLISQLPEGSNTMIGERGTRLSGGQRQRIGIARAIFRNPDILVMDEATASLDTITEQEIASSIDGMKGARTMFIVAHRLSTVRNSDRIYLMDEGKVIEEGTYDELYEKSPKFKALHGTFLNSKQ